MPTFLYFLSGEIEDTFSWRYSAISYFVEKIPGSISILFGRSRVYVSSDNNSEREVSDSPVSRMAIRKFLNFSIPAGLNSRIRTIQTPPISDSNFYLIMYFLQNAGITSSSIHMRKKSWFEEKFSNS